jgi:hypothetical protein
MNTTPKPEQSGQVTLPAIYQIPTGVAFGAGDGALIW